MIKWFETENGLKEFRHGLEAWAEAAAAAAGCEIFRLDDEDELVAEQDLSCYNCRYRRWTEDAFVCLKG
ncbi:MAG: hypothetical protein GY868_01295 [Deltaproteobacteria bacterium]|nr:hypothetical protein [Deltaproteobacteria bacterium]